MKSLFAIAFLLTLASANNNNILLDNGSGFSFKVTGNQNVPKFEFWYKNGTHYYVRLQSLFEATADLSKIPASQLSLPSLSWAFSPISTDDNETLTFNLTASGAAPRFTSNATTNAPSVKFDVLMSGYNWVDSSSATKMVLGWSLAGNDKDDPSCATDGSQVRFQDSFFKTNAVAKSGSADVNVKLVCMNGGAGGLWLVYDHFTSEFEHDPEFGVTVGSNAGLIAGVVIGVVLGVALIAAVVYFAVFRRKSAYSRH